MGAWACVSQTAATASTPHDTASYITMLLGRRRLDALPPLVLFAVLGKLSQVMLVVANDGRLSFPDVGWRHTHSMTRFVVAQLPGTRCWSLLDTPNHSVSHQPPCKLCIPRVCVPFLQVGLGSMAVNFEPCRTDTEIHRIEAQRPVAPDVSTSAYWCVNPCTFCPLSKVRGTCRRRRADVLGRQKLDWHRPSRWMGGHASRWWWLDGRV